MKSAAAASETQLLVSNRSNVRPHVYAYELALYVHDIITTLFIRTASVLSYSHGPISCVSCPAVCAHVTSAVQRWEECNISIRHRDGRNAILIRSSSSQQQNRAFIECNLAPSINFNRSRKSSASILQNASSRHHSSKTHREMNPDQVRYNIPAEP